RVLTRNAAGDLRVRPLAQHEDVVGSPRGGHGGAEAVCQRKHAHERDDDQRDSDGRREGGGGAVQHAAHVVDQGNLHATYLSASTTRSRADWTAGTNPLTRPIRMAMMPATMAVGAVTARPGTKPPASNSIRLKT